MSTRQTTDVTVAQNAHIEHMTGQIEELICWAERAAEEALATDAMDKAREERRRAHLLRTANTILRTCRRRP